MRRLTGALSPRSAAISVLFALALAGSGGCTVERPIRYRVVSHYGVDDPQFRRVMGSLLGPSLVGGNSTQTLRNGAEIFPAMLDAIHSATKTITFETYIYWKGDVGRLFTEAFCERARAGVKVNVLIDAVGSGKLDPKYVQKMKDAGVRFREYHAFHIYDLSTYPQIDHRTHRKLMVIDGKIGFTGGVGIADEWNGNGDRPGNWRDNHYRIEGPVVAQIQSAFLDNWMQSTGEVLDGADYFPPLANAGDKSEQVFRSSSQGGSENMQLMFLLSLAAAHKNVRMESAYFVPDDLTIDALIDAKRRGADVEIIVPGSHIDAKFVRDASRALWGRLLKNGIRIYEFQPTMFHCKLLVIDDRWVSIGSSNMDNRSFRLNDEANLNVLDSAFAAEQTRVFEEDKTRARLMTFDAWQHRSLGEKFRDKLFTVLGWEL